MRVNSARYFQRKEEYQPPETHKDSPFRQFIVRCLHCESFRVKLKLEFDEEGGETRVVLICSQCRRQERILIKS